MNLKLKNKSKIATGYLMVLVAFFLPLKAQFSTIAIILSFLIALPLFERKCFFTKLINNKFFLFSISYLFIHILGITYSVNLKYAFSDIESKLSFLAFPILFILVKPNQQQLNFIKTGFICGCIIALVICFIYAKIDCVDYNVDQYPFENYFSYKLS